MVQVEIDQLKEELVILNKAIAEFEGYSKGFIDNTLGDLKGFNSDFTDKMKRTLENMTDSKAPKLLKNVEKFHGIASNVVKEFKATDEEISIQLKG